MSTFLRHAIFWILIYLLWSYLKAGGTFYGEIFQSTLVNLFVYMVVYYVLQYINIPLFYSRGKLSKFYISLGCLGGGIYFLWQLLEFLNFQNVYGDAYLLETVQSFVPAMALLAIESHAEQRKQHDRREALEQEKMLSELKLLKAQINPQFLLDTLDNIYKNVIKKSPAAPDMIMRLSELLDYVLYKNQNNLVPLHEEVLSIKNFIELEEIRYEGRLEVDLQLSENQSALIVPLILLDLIQNLFRLIAIEKVESQVQINIQDQNDLISCKVDCHGLARTEITRTTEQVALADIRRQLNLVYPDGHEFSATFEGEMLHVLLMINLKS